MRWVLGSPDIHRDSQFIEIKCRPSLRWHFIYMAYVNVLRLSVKLDKAIMLVYVKILSKG